MYSVLNYIIRIIQVFGQMDFGYTTVELLHRFRSHVDFIVIPINKPWMLQVCRYIRRFRSHFALLTPSICIHP